MTIWAGLIRNRLSSVPCVDVGLAIFLAVAGICLPGTATAAVGGAKAVPVEVMSGQATIVSLNTAVAKVSLANSQVADVELISPTRMVIYGKAPGTTNLFLFDRSGQAAMFDVTVRPPIQDDQVVLQVKVAEVSRSFLRELGANFVKLTSDAAVSSYAGKASPPALATGAGQFFAGSGSSSGTSSGGSPALSLADTISTAFVYNPAALAAVIRAEQDRGLIRTLAEPNLVVRSGEKGSLLAGGRFPVPVTQAVTGGGGAVSVQYQDFGVKLNFAPEVYGDGRISLKIDPAEVSSLDFANAVILSGFRIPALKTRSTSTTVDLKEGETLILSGLLEDDLARSVAKFPLLGDIPILGALFRSASYQAGLTDLVFMITPKIVKPYAVGEAVPPPPTAKALTDREERDLSFFPLMPTWSGHEWDSVNTPK